MQNSLYVSLSAQMALQKRLETIAHNVANSSTVGFRAEEVKFESILSQTSLDPVAFAASGRSYLSRNAGELVNTGNQLDVAVEGDAWLGFQTPQGQAYTRDGRMRMTETGQLQTLTGYALLDAGGAPIALEPNGGLPKIARDGTIIQNGRQVGALGLFTIDGRANLSRFDNSGVLPDRPAAPAVDFSKVGLRQGYIERANVNPVMEMSRLIMVTRSFDAITNAINETEASLQSAIRTLGSTG